MRFTEAGHDINIVSHNLIVLNIAKRRQITLHRHPDHTIHGREGCPILYHFFTLVRPQPDGLNLFQGAVCADLRQVFIIFFPQSLAPLCLGKGGGIALLHQHIRKIGHRLIFLA